MRQSESKTVRLDVLGDFVDLDTSEMERLTGQADLDTGAWNGASVGFLFGNGESRFYETATTNRLTSDSVSATPIKCDGFRRARMQVVVASGTAGSTATLAMYAGKQNRLTNEPRSAGPKTIDLSAVGSWLEMRLQNMTALEAQRDLVLGAGGGTVGLQFSASDRGRFYEVDSGHRLSADGTSVVAHCAGYSRVRMGVITAGASGDFSTIRMRGYTGRLLQQCTISTTTPAATTVTYAIVANACNPELITDTNVDYSITADRGVIIDSGALLKNCGINQTPASSYVAPTPGVDTLRLTCTFSDGSTASDTFAITVV